MSGGFRHAHAPLEVAVGLEVAHTTQAVMVVELGLEHCANLRLERRLNSRQCLPPTNQPTNQPTNHTTFHEHGTDTPSPQETAICVRACVYVCVCGCG